MEDVNLSSLHRVLESPQHIGTMLEILHHPHNVSILNILTTEQKPERVEDEGVIRCGTRGCWDMAAGGDKGEQHVAR